MAQVRLSTGNDRLILENEHIRFVFARQRGWQLVSMRHAASGHEFIEPSAPTGPLWSIQFLSEHFRQNDIKRTFEKGVQQEIHELDSTAASACQFSSRQDDNATTLIMTWSGLQIAEEIKAADVVVEVSLAPDALYAEWRLAVKMHSPRVGVQCIDFPLIGPLAASPRAQLAVPNGWGQLIPDPTQSAGYHGHFPCGVCDMQTANLCDAGIGLYLTAHDPRGNDKEIVFTPDAAQHTLTYKLVNYPTGMGTISLGQDYAMPFAGAVGAFSGDWLTGAKIYRDWLPNAIWWSRQSVAQRADIPDWIKETTLWLQSQGAADDAAPKAKAFAEFFDVPTATHWYSWHQIPFDDHYPEYFPAKPGFAEGVRAMREAGVKVMPYINGRLWDPRNASWREEKAAFACAKDSEGHKYVEVYASKVELAIMCPTTALWQGKIADTVKRLISEYGVNAVYIDQISAAPAKLCYDAGHPHIPGGGDFWVRGYRELLAKTRAEARAVDPEAVLTTEDAAEPFADLLDAFLMCNSTKDWLVPFYPAVYSGHSLTFGRYIFREDMAEIDAFASKVGQMFVFGAQLGWLAADILEPSFAESANYMKRVAKVRRAATPYLALGELVGFPVFIPELEDISTSWYMMNPVHDFKIEPLFPIQMPQVIGSVWRADDSSLGVVMTNLGSEACACTWSLDEPAAKASPKGLVRVQRYEEGQRFDEGQFPAAKLSITAELPPHSARLYTLTAI